MKRISIALIALFLVSVSAHAADIDKVLSDLQSYRETLNTFTADFVQTKHLALLSGNVTSHGTFVYKKPGIMVWRYDPPEDTIMGIKPGLITFYFPSLKKVKRVHLSSGADIPQWMSFGMGPISDIGSVKKNATVTAAEGNGIILLSVSPTDKKEAIKEIVISLRQDYNPVRIRFIEKGGDITTIDFSNQRVNPAINDALFDVKIPAGVAIEDIGK